jgi:hypothetical protein
LEVDGTILRPEYNVTYMVQVTDLYVSPTNLLFICLQPALVSINQTIALVANRNYTTFIKRISMMTGRKSERA